MAADEYVKLVVESDGTPAGHKVTTTDGIGVDGITAVDICIRPGELAAIKLESWGPLKIEGEARVKWVWPVRCPFCCLRFWLRRWHYRLTRGQVHAKRN